MIGRIIAVAAIVAFVVAPPAEAGFWGDLKQSFGTAVDNAQRDGAKAVDAVVEGAESAADLVTGDSESAEAPAAQPLDSTAEPVADGSKQLSKQTKK
jgi:hypothetical protein